MYRVLIVDDEPYFSEGLKNLVNWEEFGLEVYSVAYDGEEALKIMQNVRINILITDIKMPKMNGIQLIEAIRNKHLDVRCIVLSGFDDFEYVKSAAVLGIENYFLKPVNEEELTYTLLNTVKKIESELIRENKERQDKTIIRNNLILLWFNNNISTYELKEKSDIIDIDLNCESYLVASVKILFASDMTEKSKSIFSFAANNIVSEVLNNKQIGLSFCEHNGDVIVLFKRSKGQVCMDEAIEILEESVNFIKTYLNQEVFVTIGSIEEDMSLVYKSYQKAQRLKEYAGILPNKKIITYDEMEKSSIYIQSDFNINLKALKAHVAAKDKQKLIPYIEEIFERLQMVEGITQTFLQNAISGLIFNLLTEFKAMNVNTDELISSHGNLFSFFYKAETLDEILNGMKDIINKLFAAVLQYENHGNIYVKKVMHYISDNYDKAVNLKVIASEMNISSQYLGQMFIKETGETFTNYLNNLRIEKAKELLLSTNLKINDITDKVGFINVNYFFAVFKKITGVSPSEYKGISL